MKTKSQMNMKIDIKYSIQSEGPTVIIPVAVR